MDALLKPAAHPADLLTHRVELARIEANQKLNARRRSDLGQYMTPAPIARLMASMITVDAAHVSILDAGAGVGSLLSAAVEALCQRDRLPRSIHVTAYEIDPVLAAYLAETMQLCEEVCAVAGITFTGTVKEADFVLDAVDQLCSPLFLPQQEQYTVGILNPPYRKIQTESLHRQQLRRVGVETSNLYTGFLSLAMRLLASNGELVAITPRSFCNGPYFRPFRQDLLQTMALRQFHLFESRDHSFRDDDVLQENIIISAVKTTVPVSSVTISSSADSDDAMPAVRHLPFDQVIHPEDPELFIHLVPDEAASRIAEQMRGFTSTLADVGIEVSTGRVVDFRASSFLRAHPADDTAPLIYPVHLVGGRVDWPKAGIKKPNALVRCSSTESLVVPNETYVLVKRFSSKEERRRIVATVYDPGRIPGPVVGFENHLNYFHTNGRGIDPMLAHGLAAFLNSTLVDEYFRQFNGHTQVNATDLRNMRYPSRDQLLRLGERVQEIQEQDALDAIIAQELAPMDSEIDPIRIKRRIEEALSVLRALDFPRAQQNERSTLTLLALLDLTPEKPWSDASDPLRDITPMMEFFARHYGKRYKPNTRETVRRQTVHQFLDAGIIIANPDAPARPVNSPKAVYQVDPTTLELVRSFGTPEWHAKLQQFSTTIQSLRRTYAQEREQQRIPVHLPSGHMLRLSPGGQNVLVKQIIDEFGSRFTPGGEVLYVGDTDEKFAYFAEDRLRELGVTVDTHGKMPDVVIYFTNKHWLVLIEAVTSHGPIDPKRRGELAFLFRGTRAGLVYVTAFLTRQAMKEYLPALSWSTEVWVAEAPDHLIHFNGDRFLGPYAPLDAGE